MTDLVKIKSIRKIKTVNTKIYDLGVPDYHTFIIEDGTVVHNCDTGQSLKAKNYNYDVLSVDRVSPDHICHPYQYFKSTIYDKRIEMFQDHLLIEEITGLERNSSTGKVDHSPNSINSKDKSDAVCGAVYNASLHADEYAFDFGEDLDPIKDVSNIVTNDSKKRTQLNIDFEQELNKMLDPLARNGIATKENTIQQIDAPVFYYGDGIIVW